MKKLFLTFSIVFSCTMNIVAENTSDKIWLPGGEAVRNAVAARRGKTQLSKLASTMAPGTWAELKTEMPKGLWVSPKVNGGRNAGGVGGLHIAGWTNDAHWDSLTGQFFYMGLRQTRQFIAYCETNNTWRAIELDPKTNNPCFRSNFGHIYGSNGYDPERSRFFHRYNSFKSEKENLDLEGGISYYDIVSNIWIKLPPKPENLGGGMAIEYHSALDGLISLGTKPTIFKFTNQSWEPMAKSPVSGYHSLMRHNPFRREVLMGGGNDNPRVVARIKEDGTIERLKDAPCNLSVQGDAVSVDPQSGRYLIWAKDKETPRELYEFDSDENEYRVVEAFTKGWPYKVYAMPVCAFITEYNVVMWAEPQGVYLYKHDPSIKYPLAGATKQGTSTENK